MATSGKTDKSPHDQEIKFFAKVCKSMKEYFGTFEARLYEVLSVGIILLSLQCSDQRFGQQ